MPGIPGLPSNPLSPSGPCKNIKKEVRLKVCLLEKGGTTGRRCRKEDRNKGKGEGKQAVAQWGRKKGRKDLLTTGPCAPGLPGKPAVPLIP